MKRFCDTELYHKCKWFRELPIEYKLFWEYLYKDVNNIGICEVDIGRFNLISNGKDDQKVTEEKKQEKKAEKKAQKKVLAPRNHRPRRALIGK